MTRHSDEDPDRDRSGEPGDPADRLDSDEVDERFAELVAGLKDESPGWPEDSKTTDTEPETETDDTAAARRAHPSSGENDEPSLLELWDAELDEDDDEEEEEEEDTYRPPAPAPLPVPSLPAILGVLLIIGGLVLIVRPMLLDVGEGLGRTTGIAGFGAGVLMLIWRLRPEPEDGEDDDPDNGAVV